MKEKIVSFPVFKNGKLTDVKYDYLFCERCEIWVLKNKPHTKKQCNQGVKGLPIRKKAEKRIIN